MKTLFLLRNFFRGILLISLLFRWFILDDKLGYNWDAASYASLALGLGGMIILEIIVYINKKKDYD